MLTVVTQPTTLDLTDATTAEAATGPLSQTDVAALAPLITQASEMVATYCGRNHPTGHEFAAQTVRQTERLTDTRECIILERDINPAITSVVEGADTLTGSDYELDGALLYRLDDDDRTTWAAEKIVINYTTGWALLSGLPRPIERATLLTLQHILSARGENPMERRYDNGLLSVSYMDTDGGLPPAAAELLKPWRRFQL